MVAPALLLALFFTLGPQPAYAAILTVCSQNADYSSIQAAVNAANAGDSIDICPETFAESVDLAAMGSNGGSMGDITLASPGQASIAPLSGPALYLTGDFAGSISLVNINGTSPDGSAFSFPFNIAGSLNIDGGGASDAAGTGLYASFVAGGATITNASFTGNSGTGVYMFVEAPGDSCSSPQLFALSSTSAGVTAIELLNTVAENNSGSGFELTSVYGDVVINSTRSTNNSGHGFDVTVFDACGGSAVLVDGSQAEENGDVEFGNGFNLNAFHVRIADTNTNSNTFDGIGQGTGGFSLNAEVADAWGVEVLSTTAAYNGRHGVSVGGVDFVTITSVSVISNEVDGILLPLAADLGFDQHVAVSSSLVISNQVGVMLENGEGSQNAPAGEIGGSIVCANLNGGLVSAGVTGNDYNAAANYWGSFTGPYHATQNPGGTGNAVIDGGSGGGGGDVSIAPWVDRSDFAFDQTTGFIGVQQLVTVTLPAGSGLGLLRGPGNPNDGPLLIATTDNGALTSAYGTGASVPVALSDTGVITFTLAPSVAGTGTITVSGPCGLSALQSVIVVNPALTVSKNPPVQAVVSGGEAAFQMAVTNTGDITLTSILVADPAAPACGRSLSDLAPGAGTTFTCTQGGVIASYTNQLTVTASALSNPPLAAPGLVTATAAAQVAVVNPTLTVSKNPPVQAVVSGGEAAFQVAVTNTGDITLTSILVADPAAPACGRSLGDLAPGAGTTFTCTQGSVIASYTNQLTVTASALSNPPLAAPGLVTATAAAQVAVVNPALTVSKNPPVQAVVSGGEAAFQVAVTNTGDITLTSILVADPAAPACGRSLSDLAPGAGTTFTCTQGSVIASYTNQLTVTASALSNPPPTNPPPANALPANALPANALPAVKLPAAPALIAVTAAARVVVINPGLSAVKSAGLAPDVCAPAGPITAPISSSIYYCVTLINTGDVTLTNHVLSDPLLGIADTPINYSLAPGASLAITRSLLPGLGPVLITSSLTNRISITSTALISEAGGFVVPAVSVRAQSAGAVDVNVQPTNLGVEPEPLLGDKRLYLPMLRR